MSVKATRHNRDTSAMERKQLRKIRPLNTLDIDCPEIRNVNRVYDYAEALASEGWKVEVEPFKDMPVLHVWGTKKTRSTH